MKNPKLFLLVVLSALAAGMAAGAAGSNVSRSVTIDGNVTNLCVLGSPNPSSVDLGVLAVTSGNSAGHLQTIANQSVQLPSSFCNYADTALTVDASALLASDTTSVQSGFTRAVNFTATVSKWATPDAAVTTAADANGVNPHAANAGGVQGAPELTDLTLTLSNFTAPGNGFLVAGSYRGSVTVTIGPALE